MTQKHNHERSGESIIRWMGQRESGEGGGRRRGRGRVERVGGEEGNRERERERRGGVASGPVGTWKPLRHNHNNAGQ